jgi:hypothetical protein
MTKACRLPYKPHAMLTIQDSSFHLESVGPVYAHLPHATIHIASPVLVEHWEKSAAEVVLCT